MGKKIKNYDLEIIKITVPPWFEKSLNRYAEDQFSQKNNRPKIVDTTKPGNAFQLNKNWIELLKSVCIYAENIKINSKQDLIEAFNFVKCAHPKKLLISERLIQALIECDIDKTFVEKLKKRVGKKMTSNKSFKGENFGKSDL